MRLTVTGIATEDKVVRNRQTVELKQHNASDGKQFINISRPKRRSYARRITGTGTGAGPGIIQSPVSWRQLSTLRLYVVRHAKREAINMRLIRWLSHSRWCATPSAFEATGLASAAQTGRGRVSGGHRPRRAARM